MTDDIRPHEVAVALPDHTDAGDAPDGDSPADDTNPARHAIETMEDRGSLEEDDAEMASSELQK